MREPVLALEGICRGYRQGERRLEVLSEASLAVGGGEQVALVGPSGSGKTTLLQIAGLLDTADRGAVRIGGADGSGASDRTRTALRRERIGFVYQFHHLLPELSALENVLLPGMIAGAGYRAAAARARDLLGKVGLAGRTEHRPADLSGGEQQRVAVCRAICNRPLILLADEPTGNLDADTADSVIAMLLELAAEEGMAMLAATHDTSFAGRLDRRVSLQRGRIVELAEAGDDATGGDGQRHA